MPGWVFNCGGSSRKSPAANESRRARVRTHSRKLRQPHSDGRQRVWRRGGGANVFGEPAGDLDLAQAALLAAIPNDPTHLAPGNDWALLRARQRFVLDLVSLGEISRPDAELAYRETLQRLHTQHGDRGRSARPFFLASAGGAAGGRVHTTIDAGLQRFVAAQTEDVIAALQRYHVTDGAALVADNAPANARLRRLPDYFDDESLGRNDGVQAFGSRDRRSSRLPTSSRSSAEPSRRRRFSPTFPPHTRFPAVGSTSPPITADVSAARFACGTLANA